MIGGGSVHVWGGNHDEKKTDLVVLQYSVNGDRYRQLLQIEIIPYDRHLARVMQYFLKQQQIDQLPWPKYSPDCNTIEHAGDAPNRAVRSRNVQPSNIDERAIALQEE